MVVTGAILFSAFILAAIVEAGLVYRVVLADRSGDRVRTRILVMQALGLLLTSMDVAVRGWGAFSASVREVTGVLFWIGFGLVAAGLVFQASGPRKKK